MGKAGKNLHKLRLSVSVYTGKSQNFPSPNLEVQSFKDFYSSVVLCMQVFYRKNHRSGLDFLLVHLHIDFSSHHHGSEVVLRTTFHIYGIYIFSATDNHTLMSTGFDFLQFMRNNENRLSGFRQVLDNLHQFVNFLRCKRGGRLV